MSSPQGETYTTPHGEENFDDYEVDHPESTGHPSRTPSPTRTPAGKRSHGSSPSTPRYSALHQQLSNIEPSVTTHPTANDFGPLQGMTEMHPDSQSIPFIPGLQGSQGERLERQHISAKPPSHQIPRRADGDPDWLDTFQAELKETRTRATAANGNTHMQSASQDISSKLNGNGDQNETLPHQPPQSSSPVHHDPREPLESYDWDDVEARFQAKMDDLSRKEEESLQEFGGMVEVRPLSPCLPLYPCFPFSLCSRYSLSSYMS